MANFFYKAVAGSGNLVDGTIEATNDKAVALKLQDMGLVPIHIGSKKSGEALKFDFRWGFGKVGAKEVLFFTQELSTLINAGLPLDRSLNICKQLSDRSRVQSLVEDILQGIKQGKTFADSLAAHPEAFSKLYVNMVRAGEVSGSLPLVLDRLVEFQQSADELKSYLISSLIYPVLLSFVGGVSIVILLNFVIPKFAQVFQDAGKALPLPTQILLTASDVSKTYWWVVLLVLGLAVFTFKRVVS